MAKKCPVRSLSDSSLAEVANVLVSTIGFTMNGDIDQDIAITMVEVQTYLETCGATSNIYQDLLRVILSSDYLEASMRFTCLQMLLNGSVQHLITEVFPFSFYEKILQVIAEQGTGLRTLNLKGVWVKEDHMHYLFRIIKKCYYLTKLYVPYIANDDLLEVISRYCTRLRVIDISGETDITDIGIEYLSKGLCSTLLTSIDLGMQGEENICHTDVATILQYCINVESLSSYSFVGRSLKYVHQMIDSNFKCKLKYVHDTKTDGDTLDIIIKTCPELESLYMDCPLAGILNKLKNAFVRKLKISKFICKELMEIVELIGNNLAHLTLIKGVGNMELGNLARLCSSLIDLDFYMMDSVTYTYQRKFSCLQGLEMLNTQMSSLALRNFICNTTSLRRLAVDSVTFNDEDLTSIFVENDFYELEDIWFTTAPNLTVAAVEILIERCPELQSIGQLSGWVISSEDLNFLRGLIKSGNSSLVISPASFSP